MSFGALESVLLGLGAGAVGQQAGNMMNWGFQGITSGNWGGTSKERKNQIHDIRTLRRKEYQDMVHSLRQAGLNPILATGASPGHATAQMVQQQTYGQPNQGPAYLTGISSARQADTAAGKAPSEIAGNLAGAGQAQAATKGILEGSLPNQLKELELKGVSIDKIRQDTATGKALEALYGQQAIEKGYSSQKLQKDIEMLTKYGPPGQSWEGLLRQLLLPEDPKASAKGMFREFLDNMKDKPAPDAQGHMQWGVHNYFNDRDYFGRKN